MNSLFYRDDHRIYWRGAGSVNATYVGCVAGCRSEFDVTLQRINAGISLRMNGQAVDGLYSFQACTDDALPAVARYLARVEEAECLRLLGKYRESAEALAAAEALRDESATAGGQGLYLDLRRLRRRALLRRSMGMYDLAMRDHRDIEKLIALDPSLGATDEFAKSLSALAELLRSMGRVDEAETAYGAAGNAFETVFRSGSAESATERGNRAEFLRSVGSTRDALPLYESCVSDLIEILGPTHPEVGKRLLNLARCHLELGHAGSALGVAQLGHAILLGAYGVGHHHVAKAESVLADVLGSPGWALSALITRLESLPLEHHHVDRSFSQLARLLAARRPGAREIRSRLLALGEAVDGGSDLTDSAF